jgi:hypothetical protein
MKCLQLMLGLGGRHDKAIGFLPYSWYAENITESEGRCIMCLFSEKWVCKQVLNDHNLLCSLQCKKHFDLLMIINTY